MLENKEIDMTLYENMIFHGKLEEIEGEDDCKQSSSPSSILLFSIFLFYKFPYILILIRLKG